MKNTAGPDMMTNDLISICVTTRHRPALLKESLESLLRQQYRPLEIVVGDNSEDAQSERMIRQLVVPEGVTLVYQRHQPAGDLVFNTNWTFSRASGGRIMWMHDDDMLCDGGLDKLVAIWGKHPGVAAVYGKSCQITHGGVLDSVETDLVNESQERTADFEGVQKSNLRSGLTQQFPTNGYLADAKLVKTVGLRPYSVTGLWGDVDFGIQLALAAGSRPFVYVDSFVSKIRMTDSRVSNNRRLNCGALQFLDQVAPLKVPPECQPAKDRLVRKLTTMAVVEAAKAGEKARAMRLLRSESYDYSWLHPATLYRLLCVLSPGTARACNRIFRGLTD